MTTMLTTTDRVAVPTTITHTGNAWYWAGSLHDAEAAASQFRSHGLNAFAVYVHSQGGWGVTVKA